MKMATIIFALTASIALSLSAQAQEPIVLSKKQYTQFKRLEAQAQAKIAAGKNCHIEYRNCWTDYEKRCSPNPGGTIHCDDVPVRRCGKPDMICD